MTNSKNRAPARREVLRFLDAAHKAAWPHNIAPTSHEGLHGFQESTFRLGQWEYLDTFAGATTDIGLEVVFYRRLPVWGVVYRGGVLTSSPSVADVFAFLSEALDAPSDTSLPIRGPARYRDRSGLWDYTFRIDGGFDSFVGAERILHRNRLCYERGLLGGRFGDHQRYGPSISLLASWLDRNRGES